MLFLFASCSKVGFIDDRLMETTNIIKEKCPGRKRQIEATIMVLAETTSDYLFNNHSDLTGSSTASAMAYNNRGTIIFDLTSWKNLSKELREAVMLHELGHLLAKLKHNDKLDSNGQPESIMNLRFTIMVDIDHYIEQRDKYFKEVCE